MKKKFNPVCATDNPLLLKQKTLKKNPAILFIVWFGGEIFSSCPSRMNWLKTAHKNISDHELSVDLILVTNNDETNVTLNEICTIWKITDSFPECIVTILVQFITLGAFHAASDLARFSLLGNEKLKGRKQSLNYCDVFSDITAMIGFFKSYHNSDFLYSIEPAISEYPNYKFFSAMTDKGIDFFNAVSVFMLNTAITKTKLLNCMAHIIENVPDENKGNALYALTTASTGSVFTRILLKTEGLSSQINYTSIALAEQTTHTPSSETTKRRCFAHSCLSMATEYTPRDSKKNGCCYQVWLVDSQLTSLTNCGNPLFTFKSKQSVESSNNQTAWRCAIL